MTKIAKIILSVSIAVLVVATSVTIVIVSTNKKHEQDSDSSHVHAFTEQKAEEKYLATPATCTEKTKYYYSCACGEKGTETFEYGDALGHSFTNYSSDNNATCTQDGTKTAKCDRCEEVNTVADEGSKLGHNFDKQVVADKYLATPATCTKKAMYYYSCACGEKGSNTFENGNALGHNFGEWETVTEPTETKKGLNKRVCVRTGCGYSESKEIPELSHEHSYTEKEVGERYLASAATCTRSATYYYSCACGVKGTATFENGSALGHNFGAWVTVKEPTETDKGLKTRTCVRTGCGYSENAEIPELAHAHSFTREYADDYYLASPATCTEKAKYYYSCACGEKGTETFEYGNPTGHSFTEQKIDDKYLVSPATCTDSAVYYYSCRCGEKASDYWQTFEYGNPKGHTEVIDAAVAATRTENGLTEGKHCSVCNEVLVEQEVIYATGSVGLTFDGNTVTGVGTCTDSEILIPACSPEGNLVTAIGDRAFANSKATAIIIPETVTSIGTRAFYNCAEITEIHIPASVTSIGTQIFYKASKLNTVYYDSSYGSKV